MYMYVWNNLRIKLENNGYVWWLGLKPTFSWSETLELESSAPDRSAMPIVQINSRLTVLGHPLEFLWVSWNEYSIWRPSSWLVTQLITTPLCETLERSLWGEISLSAVGTNSLWVWASQSYLDEHLSHPLRKVTVIIKLNFDYEQLLFHKDYSSNPLAILNIRSPHCAIKKSNDFQPYLEILR